MHFATQYLKFLPNIIVKTIILYLYTTINVSKEKVFMNFPHNIKDQNNCKHKLFYKTVKHAFPLRKKREIYSNFVQKLIIIFSTLLTYIFAEISYSIGFSGLLLVVESGVETVGIFNR